MQSRGIVLFAVLLLAVPHPIAQAEETVGKRRVYVLHSGMHIILAPADKNHAVGTLKRQLLQRGVAERDIIPLASPYPTATWSEMIPRAGLLIYLHSTDPASQASQEGYLRLHKALAAHKVGPHDDIIWIGHSAGGQMGMAMANIACHLDQYPELAKKTRPYHFAMVVTLGTAVGANPVPADVPLRHYYSAADSLILILSRHGNVVSDSIGSKVRFAPSHALGAKAKVRVFEGVEHAYWYTDAQVLDRLLHEGEPNYCPAWRRSLADEGQGVGLAQLLAKAMEAEWRISLEE